mgnify:CR=1 FL=1
MASLRGQMVLPDRTVLIGQKLVENAKIRKFKFLEVGLKVVKVEIFDLIGKEVLCGYAICMQEGTH